MKLMAASWAPNRFFSGKCSFGDALSSPTHVFRRCGSLFTVQGFFRGSKVSAVGSGSNRDYSGAVGKDAFFSTVDDRSEQWHKLGGKVHLF